MGGLVGLSCGADAVYVLGVWARRCCVGDGKASRVCARMPPPQCAAEFMDDSAVGLGRPTWGEHSQTL